MTSGYCIFFTSEGVRTNRQEYKGKAALVVQRTFISLPTGSMFVFKATPIATDHLF